MSNLKNAIASLDLQYKLGMDQSTAVDMTADIFDLNNQEKEEMIKAIQPEEVEYIPELQAIIIDADYIDFTVWEVLNMYNRDVSLCVKRIIKNAKEINKKLTK